MKWNKNKKRNSRKKKWFKKIKLNKLKAVRKAYLTHQVIK